MPHLVADIGLHFLIGASGAITARCVLGMCQHRVHQITVGGFLLLVEAAISVQLVG